MMPVSTVGRAGELDRAWSVVPAAGRSAPTVAVMYEGCDPCDRLVASLWRCTGGNPYALTGTASRAEVALWAVRRRPSVPAPVD